MRPAGRNGFSFLELFVGLTILFCGVIPIFWVMSSSTKEAQLTVSQVEATNHATNLMEAIRAAGYDVVSEFPSVMVQLEGGGGAWRFPEDPGSLTWAGVSSKTPDEDQNKAFDAFRSAFFASKLVPDMEDNFRRYVVVRSTKTETDASTSGPDHAAAPAASDGLIGVIVRVEWSPRPGEKTADPTKGPDRMQFVELRTVLGNPYRFLGGGS